MAGNFVVIKGGIDLVSDFMIADSRPILPPKKKPYIVEYRAAYKPHILLFRGTLRSCNFQDAMKVSNEWGRLNLGEMFNIRIDPVNSKSHAVGGIPANLIPSETEIKLRSVVRRRLESDISNHDYRLLYSRQTKEIKEISKQFPSVKENLWRFKLFKWDGGTFYRAKLVIVRDFISYNVLEVLGHELSHIIAYEINPNNLGHGPEFFEVVKKVFSSYSLSLTETELQEYYDSKGRFLRRKIK